MKKFYSVFGKALFVAFIVTFIGSYVDGTCAAVCFPTAVGMFIVSLAGGNVEVNYVEKKKEDATGAGD